MGPSTLAAARTRSTSVDAAPHPGGPQPAVEKTVAAAGGKAGVPSKVLIGLVIGLVPAWAMGLFPFIWLAIIPPTVVALLGAGGRRVVLPRYFGAWVTFLVFALCSVVQIVGFGALAIFGLRYGWYIGATLLLLYLLNQRDSTIVIAWCLAGLWAITIVGGWAGMLASDVSWTGPLANLLPAIVRENSFVVDLTSPTLAEVQRVGGEVLRRPSAPFAYTNNWGSTVALLTPIALATAADRRFGMSRFNIAMLTLAMLPPLAASLNRGAWLSLGIGLAYAGRLLFRNRRGVQVAVLSLLFVGVGVAIASGAVGSISNQLSARTTDSNETRTSLYRETIEETIRSPLLGYGSPRASAALEDGPPVGTHGQIWMVMFSHGAVAAVAYGAFFGLTFLAMPTSTNAMILAKASLLVGLVQTPYYGHLPQQLFIMMAVVAFLYHEHNRHRGAVESTPASL